MMRLPQLVLDAREHAFMRWGLAGTIVLAFVTKPITAEEQLHPKGIANFVDLTFLADERIAWTLIGIGAIAATAYAAKRAQTIAMLYLVALCTAVFTFSMSHITKVRHDTNILPLVLIGQLIAHAHYAIATRAGANPFGRRTRDDLSFDYSQQMIAAMYVLSGITKLIRCGFDWVSDSVLITLQLVRTQHNEFYDHLAPADGLEYWLSVGRFLVEHENLTRMLFGGALVLELFAFTALFGRVWSLLVGLALIGFHLSVYATMNINFYLNMLVLSLFFVNVPYWIGRLRSPSEIAPA